MRIVMITPGSGDHFYCENCRRDLDLVQALRAQGHDALMVPLYLPIAEAQATGAAPVFYGAVNVYLEQRLPLVRWLPQALRRQLDSAGVLGWAAARARSIRAGGLEAMTLSVLRGEDGRQAEELDRLIAWLCQEAKPDVIHLSNALLLGLAGRLRAEVKAPVVCSLQDEDHWVDAMPAPWPIRIWETMAERSRNVDLFLPVSRSYGERLAGHLGLTPERWRVVYPGIDSNRCELLLPPAAPVIGYYARLSADLGLGDVAQAFFTLRKRPELRALRLHAAGGMTADDAPFLGRLRTCIREHGAESQTTITEVFRPGDVEAFMGTVTTVCVPVPGGEAFGLFSLEALARGVPVVLPAEPAFAEVAQVTKGVLLYPPGDREALVEALARVLLDRDLRQSLAQAGRAGVRQHFDLNACAVPALLAAYASVAR
jgi:glycosyltransferase involved in cell wall biosynthesis